MKDSFFDDIKDYENNLIETKKGALGFKSSKNALVDFLFKVSSYRFDKSTLFEDMLKAYNEDSVYFKRLMFYIRDVRQGMGERDLFREMLSFYIKRDNFKIDEAHSLIENTPLLGRFDDLVDLYFRKDTDNNIKDMILSYFKNVLKNDAVAVTKNENISLLAKWLPSENASSKETRRRAKILAKDLGFPNKKYRTTLSFLRNYLDIVETRLSNKELEAPNFEKVPSKAMLKYRNAFSKRYEGEYQNYLDSLSKGEAKINVSTLTPVDIVRKYKVSISSYRCNDIRRDDALEQLWSNLKDVKIKDTIVVSDGSGSMYNELSPQAIEVAMSLAIYFSERNNGALKDNFITFSESPRLVNLSSCNFLFEKLEVMVSYREVANTDIEAVFDLILNTAIKNGYKKEDMPENVLIISDMEFDRASGLCGEGKKESLFKIIQKKYEDKRYSLPRLIFWNVESRTKVFPMTIDDNVVYLSGFSQNVFDLVIDGDYNAWQMLKKRLDEPRYADV